MRKILAGAVAALAGMAVVPSMSHAARVSAGAGAAPSATLYSAAFKTRGIKGWRASTKNTWNANRKGIVTFKGQGLGELMAPFSTKTMHDFAIETSIAPVGAPLQSGSGYGISIRGFGPASGILGGSFSSADPAIDGPAFSWLTDSVGGNTVKLKSGYNLYRIEVHGADYTLLINGHVMVRFTISDFNTGTVVGVWAGNQKLNVKAFKVIRLKSGSALPVLPPVKALDLSPTDVPVALQSLGGHYYTNEEVARLNGVPLSTVHGRRGHRLRSRLWGAKSPGHGRLRHLQ